MEVELVMTSCARADCGVVFALTAPFERRRRADGQTFFCPHGHGNGFATGKPIKDQLADALAQGEKQAHRARRMELLADDYFAELTTQKKRAASQQGQATRLRKRLRKRLAKAEGGADV